MVDKEKRLHTIKIKEMEAISFEEEMSIEEKEQLKRRVLEEMKQLVNKEDKYKGRKWKTLKIAAAAVAVAIMLPATYVTANKLVKYFYTDVKQDQYKVDMQIKKEKEVSGTMSPSKEVQPVKLEYDLPDTYEMHEENGGYYFSHKDGFEAGKNFDVELIQIDQTVEKKFLVLDVAEKEDININGNKGVYLQQHTVEGSQYLTGYGQRVVVFYEKEGYVLQFYAGEGIKKDTLLQYARNITIKPCEQKEKSQYILMSEYLQHNLYYKNVDEEVVKPTITIPKDRFISQNQTVQYNGMEYQVQKVEVLDNITPLMKENGKGVNDCLDIWKKRLEFSEQDGTLKAYVRERVELGNGYTSPREKVVETKEVAQRFVLVELRVKNITKERKNDVLICLNMDYMKEKDGEYQLDYTCYNRPRIIEDCRLDGMAQYFKETDEGAGGYLKGFAPGQEEVYHIGYFVDEDYVDKMLLNINSGVMPDDDDMDQYWLDIRQ